MAGSVETDRIMMIGHGKQEMTAGATTANCPISDAASIILTLRRIQNNMALMGQCILRLSRLAGANSPCVKLF